MTGLCQYRRLVLDGCMSSELGRVCIVLPKGIGDVVLGLSVATAFKRKHPEAHLTWVTYPVAAPILNHHRAVDQVIEYSALPFRGRWNRLRGDLRKRPFDVLLNLGMYAHSLPPVLFAKSRRVIGLGRPFSRDGLWYFHHENVEPLKHGHTLDQYFQVLAHLDIAADPVDWSLSLTADEQNQRAEYIHRTGPTPRIGIVATSGRPEKDWPEDRFVEFAVRMNRCCGASTLLLGGPGHAETTRARKIQQLAGSFVQNELGTDLRRLIWLLTVCDVIVAPDTGPIHMARALDVPVIGLYGHTDPKRYGPYHLQRGVCIDRYNFDASDVPSAWQGKGGRAHRMELISVAEVEAACLRLLDTDGAHDNHPESASGEVV
jgi:heptosyltransferase I